MTMNEIVEQVEFMLGLPSNKNVENLQTQQAVMIAFRELKRYMKTPVDKTVPFATRIDLSKVGIQTKRVLYVQAAYPRIGLTLSTLDAGNVFQVAASLNNYSGIGQTSSINVDPIVTEMAMAQVRNTISTDFQWKHDPLNNCIYCTHRDPVPTHLTIRYVPIFNDVSEINNDTWLDYLIRMSEANMKKALGRSRSKYTIEGSNVTLDGDVLLQEANTELEAIRAELEGKKNKLVVLN
nr:MAG TPA: neck protein [Caudoviricetes sp.]